MKKPILTSLFPVAMLALAAAVHPASAETFNFTVPLANQTIPDGTLPLGTTDTQTPASAINVIQGISLTLNIAGTVPLGGWNGDLYAFVQHVTPGGTGFSVLLYRVGTTASDGFGYSDTGFSVTFSDTATNGDIHTYQSNAGNYAAALNPATGLISGTWQPDGRTADPNTTLPGSVTDLSPRNAMLTSGSNPFTGLSAKGGWTVFIADGSAGGAMTLTSWSLDISGISGPFYWKGQTDGSWSTIGDHISNWAADQTGTPLYALPTATDDVIFSANGAGNRNTTLDQDFTIQSLTIKDTNPVTISSGTGGTHTLTLSGAAGTGLDVQASAGLVTIGANLTLGLLSDTITVNNAAGAIITGSLGGSNGLNKLGTGTLTLAGANTYTGNTTVDGGGLTITGSVGNGTSTDTFTVGNNNGGTNLTISGGGVVTSGKTVIGFAATSNNNTVLLDGAGSQWNTSGTYYLGLDGSGNTMTVSGGAKFTLSNTSNFDALIGANAGANNNKLTVTGAGSLFSNLNAPNASTLYIGRNGTGNEMDILLGGSVSSFNARIGGGTGSNSFTDNNKVLVDGTGSLWTVGGTLRVGSDGTNTNLTISNGGVVNVTGNTFLGYNAASTGNTALVTGTGSQWNVAALVIGSKSTNNTVIVADGGALSATSITLGLNAASSGTLQIGNGAGAGTVTGSGITTGAGTGTVIFNHTDASYTFAPLISGTTSVQHNGTGTTLLTALNTYTGTTTISAGTLSVGVMANGGAASGIGQSANAASNLVFDGGTLQYTGATVTSDRAFTINAGKTATFDVTTLGTNLTLAGATGPATTGGLSKIGLGTLTLTGVNTYTGTTSVTAGQLNINGSTDAGSQVNVATAGTLGGSGTVNGNATLTGNGVINFGATGNIVGTLGITGGNWNGLGTVGGQATSSSSNFNIGSGANLTATTGLAVTGGTFSATDGTAKLTGSLNYTSTTDSVFAGEIAGAVSTVTMNSGNNTHPQPLILSGNNTYGGVTTVTSGQLAALNNNALGLTTAGTTVASGASLNIYGGINIGAEPLTITGVGNTISGVSRGALFGGGGGGGTSGYAGAITLAGPATIATNASPTIFNLTGGISTAGNTLTLGAGFDLPTNVINISSVPVSGAGNVVVELEITSFGVANTYTGTTSIINVGTLKANVVGALPAPAADGGTGTVRSAVLMDQSGGGGAKLTLGANQAIASLTGTTTSSVNLNASTLTIGTGAGTTDFQGTISGVGGGLVKDGASTQQLSGPNTYTGPTTVNGGTLIAASTQALGLNSAVTVNANSVLDATANITIGSLSGGGANSFVRDTPVGGPVTLTLGTLNTNTTYSGVIQDGAGKLSLAKVGTGTQTLTGTNTFTGGTTVNAGTLAAGSAKAFGSGNLTMTAGTLRTTGLLSVDIGAGNILFGGGTYVANVGGTTPGVNHDQLKTTGSANITGGTLALVQQGGYILAPGDQVKLLLAAGGVAGGSANGTAVPSSHVTGLSAFSNNPLLVPTVNLYTDSVILEAMQGSFASLFGTLPFTPNQMAVANALDSAATLLGKKTGLIAEFNFLDTQPIGTLLDNLNKIAPDELTAIFANAVALANVQSANLERHMDDIRSGSATPTASGMAAVGSGPSFSGSFAGPKGGPSAKAAPADDERWGVFLTGSGEFTRVGSTTNAAGFHFETAGVTGGIDYRVSDHLAIGLDFGYVGSTASLVNGGSIDTDGGRLGIYGTYFDKNFHVDAAVNGGINSYRTKRVTPNNTVATGSPNGSEVNILLSTGYDWKIGKLTLGPTASYQYTNVRLDSFTEAGAFLPLAIAGQTAESSRTGLGFHATYDTHIGRFVVRPEARLTWQHEFDATSSSITSRFANIGGNPFTVTGPKTGRDSLVIGTGVSVQWSPRCASYLYYDGEVGRTNYSSHSVSAGFRFQF